MDERRKNLLKDIKVCGQALSNITAEHDEEASRTRGSFGSKVVEGKLAVDARRSAGGDMKSQREPLLEATRPTCVRFTRHARENILSRK